MSGRNDNPGEVQANNELECQCRLSSPARTKLRFHAALTLATEAFAPLMTISLTELLLNVEDEPEPNYVSSSKDL